MSDDDLIRRGDALRVADEVFDKCENVHGDDRGAFAAAEVGARIAALPAVTVGVKPLVWQPTIDSAGNPHTVTVAFCPVFEKRFYAEGLEDQARIDDKRAARILAALATTDAATQKGGDAHDRRLRSHEASPGVTAGADAAQAREAALMVALHDAVNAPKGVVPDSAVPFWNAAILRAMER